MDPRLKIKLQKIGMENLHCNIRWLFETFSIFFLQILIILNILRVTLIILRSNTCQQPEEDPSPISATE